MSKLHIKKGDTVIVNAGDDRGKQGRVVRVLVSKNKAVVEGVNVVSKSTKPSAKHPQGGIVKMEAPIHVSNLSLIDPKYVILKNQERRLNNERYNRKERL